MFEYPTRDYATVPAPAGALQVWEGWPIPAPEVIRNALDAPLRGMWIDHVPTGAEITAMNLLWLDTPEAARRRPLATGEWSDPLEAPWLVHPEHMGAQTAMPDTWFNHADARGRPARIDGDEREPEPGRTVETIIGLGMSGSGNKRKAERLPELWRRGLLRTPEERLLANEVLKNTWASPVYLWHSIVLDEGWTMRRAAQVLREAGICNGQICAWTNQWARRPAGSPPPGSAPAETAREVNGRCVGQLGDDGPWPLTRTAEIAATHQYRRVE